MRGAIQVSAVLAMALTFACASAARAEDSGLKTRLYLTSSGKADSAGGDGKLIWGPSTRGASDKYTFDPKSTAAVLVYATAVLDRPLQTAGAVAVEFYATSDAADTNFTAAVEDVQPDGQVVPLGSKPVSIVRAGDRNKAGFYSINLGNIAHTFLPGHRIRLEISSSASLISADWQAAHQMVLHDIAHPSALVLRVVE